jgi:MaoC dehydratase-like protein
MLLIPPITEDNREFERMTGGASDHLREQVEAWIGRPMGASGPAVAPDDVNLAMIRHWVDALDDRNPVYLDEAVATTTRFGGIVAPPAMLQTWTMARPRIEGIAARGGAAAEIDGDSPLGLLTTGGFTGTLATNSELEFARYLRLGDRLQSSTALESVSERKATALGLGYFITWVSTYTDDEGAVVGRQRFRIYKFEPGSSGSVTSRGRARPSSRSEAGVGEELAPFDLDVTATVVVAGAIASRDFMPAHHDRGFATAQGAPDIFMNILTTNGYVSRYVTDWAGPDTMLRSISIRLGAPAVPGYILRFTGWVMSEHHEEDERVIEVAIRAANDLGDHLTGTVVLTLPSDGAEP